MVDDRKWFRTQAEMGRAYDKNPKTIALWVGKPTFPKQNARTGFWSRGKVANWVEKHQEALDLRAKHTGDKGVKTRLECERLRVVIDREREALKQAKLDTERTEGRLVERAAVLADDHRRHQSVRGALESFRQHETAKHPEHREMVNGLCDRMLEAIRDAISKEG